MSGVQVGLLVVLCLCILASAFFSGSETALVAVPRERVHMLAASDRRGQRLAALTSNPERMLGTLLLANNFVNILAASVATVLAIQLIGARWGPWVATLLITSVILVVGEITPKTLTARSPVRYALLVATPILWLARILHPIAHVFVMTSRGVLRLLRVTDRARPVITEDDITALATLSEIMGAIDTEEREIIESVFDLADRPVREVMTPRVDVVSLEPPLSEEAIRRAVASTGHSRFPVREQGMNLDHIAGVLHIKDLLRAGSDLSPNRIRALLREASFVPESTPILKLLQDMRKRRFGFAIVLDEHGGVEGIVTIKDLMSELVGDIQDEYDPSVPVMVPVATGTWIVDGAVPVDELSGVVGRALPEGPYATVAGLYLATSGEIPQEGSHVEVDGISITILSMEGRRIARVRVERPDRIESSPQ